MINISKFSLSLATVAAVFKIIWVLALSISPRGVQMFFDWLAEIHFVDAIIVVHPVEFWTAILTICFTFVVVCIVSALIAWIINIMYKYF